MSDEPYDDGRAERLERMLRALARRIRELDDEGALLRDAGELTRLIGHVRSELFHYEVRATYDSPETAAHRRIVSEAREAGEAGWVPGEWTPDDDEDGPKWRK